MTEPTTIQVQEFAKKIKLHWDIDVTNDMLRTANWANELLGKSERYLPIPYPQ